jgi:hypothetical protein
MADHALDQVNAALITWLAMLLVLTCAFATVILLARAFADLVLNPITARERRRRLREPCWVGRDQRTRPGLWRVGDSVVPVTCGRALSWGIAGPATERLAELILGELVSAREARRLAAPFAAQVLAGLPLDGFVLPESQVRAWLRRGFRPLRLAWSGLLSTVCALVHALRSAPLTRARARRTWRGRADAPGLVGRPPKARPTNSRGRGRAGAPPA